VIAWRSSFRNMRMLFCRLTIRRQQAAAIRRVIESGT
jgi:hypothetical protein